MARATGITYNDITYSGVTLCPPDMQSSDPFINIRAFL